MSAVQCPNCETVNQIANAKVGARHKCVFCDQPFVVDVTFVPDVPQRQWDAAPPPSILASDRFGDEPDSNLQVVQVLRRIEELLDNQGSRVRKLHWLAVFFAVMWALGVVSTAIAVAANNATAGVGLLVGAFVSILIAVVAAELRN